MNEILLKLDFMSGPIWDLYNKGTEVIDGTGISVIDNDPVILELNESIRELYDSYFTFNDEDAPYSFDNEAEKADKQKMLDLLKKLNERLSLINDGSFHVIDEETSRISKL